MPVVYQMDTLKSRDRALEMMWDELADVPFDEDENGRLILSEGWMCFEAGTEREDVWRWFDERHSCGVAYLLHGDGVDRTCKSAQLLYFSELCDDCVSRDCAYNSAGECRYPMVHHRVPIITKEDGCTEGVIPCS